MTILEIDINHPLYQAERNLRSRVLRIPLGFPPGSEAFPFEPESRHFIAVVEGQVSGCVLMHLREEGVKLYQMAVDSSIQKQGVGRKLVEHFERDKKIEIKMTLSARGCPVGDTILQHVQTVVSNMFPGYYVDVDLVWEPQWTPELITEDGRAEMDNGF